MNCQKTLKILVSGDVDGQFKQLFSRVNSVNKKAGPFDMLLVTGDFFGTDCDDQYEELINGSIDLPSMPVYILGPTKQLLEKYYKNTSGESSDFNAGFEIVEGLIYLGKKGILTGDSRIRIMYLSGTEAEHAEGCNWHFDKDDYQHLMLSLQSSSNTVDIFITSQWPQHVLKYCDGQAKESEETNEKSGSLLISKVVGEAKPRYHFTSGKNSFFERNPFRNHKMLVESAKHVTRFISIASIGNPNKAKWLYAFSIVPAAECDRNELTKQPSDTTENPFSDLSLEVGRSRRNQPENAAQFFYDLKQDHTEQESGRKRFNKRDDFQNKRRSQPNRTQPVSKDPCWFCLASPEVEKHLIISIGEHSYLALAKGGLTDDHLLILPIAHHRSVVEMADNPEIVDEINKFKEALTEYFDTKGFCLVFFERNFKSSHLQIQVVPVKKEKSHDLKTIILDISEERDLQFNELPQDSELKDVLNPGLPYFYMEVPNSKFFVRIKGFFPLQLGRELMAHVSVLNCPDRIDWKQCAMDKAQATEVANKIRDEFKPFDFTVL